MNKKNNFADDWRLEYEKQRLGYLEKKINLKIRIVLSIATIMFAAIILMPPVKIEKDTYYWFFSTVAQSFAALLGLAGIFIIFRIQMLKEEFYTTSRTIALRHGWGLDLPVETVMNILFAEKMRIQEEIDKLKKEIKEENLEKQILELESKKRKFDEEGCVLLNYISEQHKIKGLFMFPLFEMSILILSSIVGIVSTPALERYTLYNITLGYILLSFVIMFILWALYDFIDIIFLRIFYRGGRNF